MTTLFITGTDTGVGKTLLTGLLLAHLRERGEKALALKPFSAGSRADARLLQALQSSELTLEEINPFHFSKPVAPLVAAGRRREVVPLRRVLSHVGRVADRCDRLLIEGIGGLLVPLGSGYLVRDVIQRLKCDVILVSRNQLGTINHTLLSVEALLKNGKFNCRCRSGGSGRALRHQSDRNRRGHSRHALDQCLKVVLMDPPAPDFSSRSNALALARLLAPIPLISLPFLGPGCQTAGQVRRQARALEELLAQILKA